jgi:hypothetical protein
MYIPTYNLIRNCNRALSLTAESDERISSTSELHGPCITFRDIGLPDSCSNCQADVGNFVISLEKYGLYAYRAQYIMYLSYRLRCMGLTKAECLRFARGGPTASAHVCSRLSYVPRPDRPGVYGNRIAEQCCATRKAFPAWFCAGTLAVWGSGVSARNALHLTATSWLTVRIFTTRNIFSPRLNAWENAPGARVK